MVIAISFACVKLSNIKKKSENQCNFNIAKQASQLILSHQFLLLIASPLSKQCAFITTLHPDFVINMRS